MTRPLGFEPDAPCALWSGSAGDVEVRFTGRGPALDRDRVLATIEGEARDVAWAKQVHGGVVLEGHPGFCGEGDALETLRRELALSVATADCVPVLLASATHVAAVHAGWRGLVAGVIAAAVQRLADPAATAAWIGPAIGPCCYEVGADVAEQVVASSRPSIVRPGPRERPHLDLFAAASHQLERAGVASITALEVCTACDPRLWSYRRDGKRAGRNIAYVWRRRAA